MTKQMDHSRSFLNICFLYILLEKKVIQVFVFCRLHMRRRYLKIAQVFYLFLYEFYAFNAQFWNLSACYIFNSSSELVLQIFSSLNITMYNIFYCIKYIIIYLKNTIQLLNLPVLISVILFAPWNKNLALISSILY